MRDRELAAVEEVRISFSGGTSPAAPEAEAVAAADAEVAAAAAHVPPSVYSRPHAALVYDEAEGGAEEAVEAEAAAAEAEAEEAEAAEAEEAVEAAGVVAAAEVTEAAVEAILERRIRRGHARRHIFSAGAAEQHEEAVSEGGVEEKQGEVEEGEEGEVEEEGKEVGNDG